MYLFKLVLTFLLLLLTAAIELFFFSISHAISDGVISVGDET